MTAMNPGGDKVTLSRNETESLCMKAARGAGFSWGMAEEAGFASGWLAAHGIDGAAAVLEMLTLEPGRSSLGTPRPTPGHWQSLDDSPLCPIHLGAALIDRALLSDGPFSRDTQLDPVQTPLLLLPFLFSGAQICRKSLVVDWQGGLLHITPDGAFDSQAAIGLTGPNVLAKKITLSLGVGAWTRPGEPMRLPLILVSTLNGLSALALRTTVPATSSSRSGAGSSETDND